MDVTDWENRIEEEIANAESAPRIGDYKLLMTESGYKFYREIETEDDFKTIIGGYEKTIGDVKSAIERIKQGLEIEWDDAVKELRKYGLNLQSNLSLYNQHPESRKCIAVNIDVLYPEDENYVSHSEYRHEIKGSLKHFVEQINAFAAENRLVEHNKRLYFTKALCMSLFRFLDGPDTVKSELHAKH